MTRSPKTTKPVKHQITDVILSVYSDPSEEHAQITLYPAPTLWAQGPDPAYVFDENIDERTAEASQHLLAGLLARLALDLQYELALEQALHGCTAGHWYAESKADRSVVRRLGKGDMVRDDEHITTAGYGDHCCTTGPDDGLGADRLFDFCVYVTVPRRRLGYYKRRVSELLDLLVAGIPQ